MKTNKIIFVISLLAAVMLMTSCADDYLTTSNIVDEVIDPDDKEGCIKRDVEAFLGHIKDGDYRTLDGISTSDGVKLVSRNIAAGFSDKFAESASLPVGGERLTKALFDQMKEFDFTIGTPIISADGNNAEVAISISCICYADFMEASQVALSQMKTDASYYDRITKNVSDKYVVGVDEISSDMLATYFFEEYIDNELRKYNNYSLTFSMHNEGSYWAVSNCDDLSKLASGLTMGWVGYEKGNLINRNIPDNTNNDTNSFVINIFN